MNDRPPELPGQVNNMQVHSKRQQQSQRVGKGQGHSNSPKQECFQCGGKHSASTCRFKQYKYHFCKKHGHLSRVCRKREKGSGTPDEAHHVGSDNTSVEEEYNPFHNSNPISMEIDTGVSVSLISLETFESIRHGESILELEQTPVELQTYNEGRINVYGSTQVEVSHMGQTLTLPLVTEGSGPALLGRNWMEAFKLDWQTIA